MTPDDELYAIMCDGLGTTEDRMKALGVPHWKVAMVAYDPTNPKAYMVIGSAGEEAVQSKIAAVIRPEDANRPPDFVASPARRIVMGESTGSPDKIKRGDKVEP